MPQRVIGAQPLREASLLAARGFDLRLRRQYQEQQATAERDRRLQDIYARTQLAGVQQGFDPSAGFPQTQLGQMFDPAQLQQQAARARFGQAVGFARQAPPAGFAGAPPGAQPSAIQPGVAGPGAPPAPGGGPQALAAARQPVVQALTGAFGAQAAQQAAPFIPTRKPVSGIDERSLALRERRETRLQEQGVARDKLARERLTLMGKRGREKAGRAAQKLLSNRKLRGARRASQIVKNAARRSKDARGDLVTASRLRFSGLLAGMVDAEEKSTWSAGLEAQIRDETAGPRLHPNYWERDPLGSDQQFLALEEAQMQEFYRRSDGIGRSNAERTPQGKAQELSTIYMNARIQGDVETANRIAAMVAESLMGAGQADTAAAAMAAAVGMLGGAAQ